MSSTYIIDVTMTLPDGVENHTLGFFRQGERPRILYGTVAEIEQAHPGIWDAFHRAKLIPLPGDRDDQGNEERERSPCMSD